MASEIREIYYEIYINGQFCHEGAFEDCQRYAQEAQPDDLEEIYKVTITEEKIFV